MRLSKKYKHVFLILAVMKFFPAVKAQQLPSLQENMACLVTFGSNSGRPGGNADFSQTVFFVVPGTRTEPFYIRVFDPEAYGELDEAKGGWDTQTRYSVYGGKEAYYHKDARSGNPAGNYKSGTLITTKTFGGEASTDHRWISFGPFDPQQGELVSDLEGRVLKLVIEGLKGNDANGCKLFLSTNKDENVAVEGGNAFTFRYNIRMQPGAGSVAHAYPFAENLVTGLRIHISGINDEGDVKLYSAVKNGHLVSAPGTNTIAVLPEERNKCFDLQIFKRSDKVNTISLFICNEYDVPVPFFAIPPGGIPRYKYEIKVTKTPKAR